MAASLFRGTGGVKNFWIGEWLIQPDLNRIVRSDRKIHVEPKVMQVLLYLSRHPGEVLSKERIMEAVWHDSFVTDDALVRAIRALRGAFEDDVREPRVIQTIPTKGYRLLPRVLRKTQFESLAVLPLANLSGDPEQDYLVDGIHDALIAELAPLRTLRVISRMSVLRYKAEKRPIVEIGRKLQVEAIIEGSVLYIEERVRVTVALFQVDPERCLWNRSYERNVRDILSLQRNIAHKIAREIQILLTPLEEGR